MSPELSFQPKVEKDKPFLAIIPDASRVDWANTVSKLTIQAHARGEMLARTTEEVLGMFKKGNSVILTDVEGNFLSHAGVTFKYPDRRIEVGAVCTSEQAQGNGFGKSAVELLLVHLKQKYPGREVFALANKASEGLFEKVGGVRMSYGELHPEVFDACKGCSRRPTDGAPCCDTPFNLTFEVKKTAEEVLLFDPQKNLSDKI